MSSFQGLGWLLLLGMKPESQCICSGLHTVRDRAYIFWAPAQAQCHMGFTEPETGGKISPSGKKKKEEKQKPLNTVKPHASLAPQTRGFLSPGAGSPGCTTYPQARCSASFVLDTNTPMDAICWHKTRLPKGFPSHWRHGPWSGPPRPDNRLAVCGATPCYSYKPFPGNSAPRFK